VHPLVQDALTKTGKRTRKGDIGLYDNGRPTIRTLHLKVTYESEGRVWGDAHSLHSDAGAGLRLMEREPTVPIPPEKRQQRCSDHPVYVIQIGYSSRRGAV
jgi:hypothetical protein